MVALALPVQAGVNVMQKDDSYLDVGILIEVQGRAVQNPIANTAIDDGVFFRRLRPFLYGAMNKNWQGIIQMDFSNAIRYSATYSLNNNVVGVTGLYENVARLQAQFAW